MKRELDTFEFSINWKLLTQSERKIIAASVKASQARSGIIVTRHLDQRALEHQATTGQRLFVQQIARGVYRQISDDNGQATTLGIGVAAALTILAVNLITNMVFLFSDVGDPIMRAQDLTFYSSVAVGVFLIYALIWLRIGAQTISKLRRQIA